MSPAIITVVVLGLISTVIGGVALARRESKLRRMASIAKVDVANAVVGNAVRVEGEVRCGEAALVRAPYSGTPCVAAVGERWEKSSTNQRLFRLDRVVRDTTFEIADATGSVRVLGGAVEYVLELSPTTIATSGANRVFGAGIIAANTKNLHEMIEGTIIVGARVSAVGLLQKSAADGTLELAASPGHPVTVTSL